MQSFICGALLVPIWSQALLSTSWGNFFGYWSSELRSKRLRSIFTFGKLQLFLHNRGIATSLINRYNLHGNGQIERCNEVFWQSIVATLQSHKLSQHHWNGVLLDVLHAKRLLLCTGTNSIAHEQMLMHFRKFSADCVIPSWLKPSFILSNAMLETSISHWLLKSNCWKQIHSAALCSYQMTEILASH